MHIQAEKAIELPYMACTTPITLQGTRHANYLSSIWHVKHWLPYMACQLPYMVCEPSITIYGMWHTNYFTGIWHAIHWLPYMASNMSITLYGMWNINTWHVTHQLPVPYMVWQNQLWYMVWVLKWMQWFSILYISMVIMEINVHK